MGKNPFPKKPPKYIRATLYHYHFTTWDEKSERLVHQVCRVVICYCKWQFNFTTKDTVSLQIGFAIDRITLHKWYCCSLCLSVAALFKFLVSFSFSNDDWWVRTKVREYLPILSKKEPSFINYLKNAGIYKVSL